MVTQNGKDLPYVLALSKDEKIRARKILSEVSMQAHRKYINKENERGVNWVNNTFDDMYKRYMDHVSGLVSMVEDPNHKSEYEFYQQILDVINYAKILGAKAKLQGYKH